MTYFVEGSGAAVVVIGSAVYYPRTFSGKFNASIRVAYSDLRHFALSEAIGFERFVLIGHSHHGNLALEYAKRHPERVSHLVLIGMPPCNVRRTVEEAERCCWAQSARRPGKW